MADKKGGNLALIFGDSGGGSSGDAAAPGGPSSDELDADVDALGEDLEADAPPPDFAVHAAEAFPELAGDDARLEALYRAVKACHPVA